MPAYFVVSVSLPDAQDRERYDEYIEKVKPVAERFGGRYLTRSERITALSDSWTPDRVIIIRFASKEQIMTWLSSPEYQAIADLRRDSVAADAIIVEED